MTVVSFLFESTEPVLSSVLLIGLFSSGFPVLLTVFLGGGRLRCGFSVSSVVRIGFVLVVVISFHLRGSGVVGYTHLPGSLYLSVRSIPFLLCSCG